MNESNFMIIYAYLLHDMNKSINDKLNNFTNKEKSLKFITNEKCVSILNSYKTISPNNNNKLVSRDTTLGYVRFVFELIKLELLKEQLGILILEQFYKKYKDENLNQLIKQVFLEAYIFLLNKLGKLLYDKNNTKLMQNINNYIKDNLLPIIDDKKSPIPNYLKYKIINLVEKSKLSWKDSLLDIEQNENNNKIILKISKGSNTNETKTQKEEIIKVIKQDLINYINYLTKQDDIEQKNGLNESYNWKNIDDIIYQKKYGLEYIIKIYLQVCIDVIENDEKKLSIANDYIKNIIEYYSINLPKSVVGIIHNEMIAIFLNINDILKNNESMYKIMGYLLFILIENKLYQIKYFNNYLKAEMETQVNLAKITKFCIIYAGKFAKKYFNDFKQTKLFVKDNIFKQYVDDTLKDFLFFLNNK